MATLAAQDQAPPPTIDGSLEDAFWKEVPPAQFSPEDGGKLRAVVAGRFLCVAADLPEPSGRITARSFGQNPAWEEEDLLRITAGASIGYTDRSLLVNPLGAYSVEKALPVPRWSESVFPYSDERAAQVVFQNVEKFLVATRVHEKSWSVEVAFPLSELSAPVAGNIYVTIERVRAQRASVPREDWRWPGNSPAAKVAVIPGVKWEAPPPTFRPVLMGNQEVPVEVGRVTQLPPLNASWDDAAWRDAPAWGLLRDERPARLPAIPTEVKLLHDGRSLAVLARCVEPDTVAATVKENDGRAEQDDSFQVYLATSGSMYAQIVINALGYLQDTAGFSGGPRISRQREWDSGARASVAQGNGAWTARLDIPLESVAHILGESHIPGEWRILLRRYRRAREGEAAEISGLPIVQSETPRCPPRYRRLSLSERALSTISSGRPEDAAEAPDYAYVLTPDQRRQIGLAGMVERQIRQRVIKILEADRNDWEQVHSRAQWETFRDRRINALRDSLGEFPTRTSLETKVTKEYRGQGYLRQDLVYRSRPGVWVTANLYLPANPPSRMPGIVIVHSHHRPRTQAELQDMGILWARAGCAVLIMDQIGHGERIVTYPWNREGYHARYATGMQLYIAGESLMAWMAWDIIRGIDLLLERSDIDKGKIILLGAVAGGGDPAAVVAAIDPRVTAVAPFNFGEATPELGPGNSYWPNELADPGWGSWETTRDLRRSIIDRFFPWTIVASVAPRRLIFSYEMGWDVEQVPAWIRYRTVFGFYGALDLLDEAHGVGEFPGPGECANIGPSQRTTLYPELQRWFGIPPPDAEPDDRRPEDELAALTPGLAEKLGMRSFHEIAGEIAESKVQAARDDLAKLDAAGRREWLREGWRAKLGDIEPNREASAVSQWQRQSDNARVEGITLEVEPGITVPMLLLRPLAVGDSRTPVAVVVSQRGKAAILAHHRSEVGRLLAGDVAVCLPDLRGIGETSPDHRRIPLSAGIGQAATELMLGNTMLGARLKDLRTVLAYLAARPDVDAGRMAVWGNSDAVTNPVRLVLDEMAGWRVGPEIQQQAEPLGGLLALLAGLYEDDVRVVAVRRGLTGYLSVLEDNFPYVPSDVIVPGVAEVGDIADLAAALAPRPLLLVGMVNGRNQPVGGAELDSRIQPVLSAYRQHRENLSTNAESDTAEWLRLKLQNK